MDVTGAVIAMRRPFRRTGKPDGIGLTDCGFPAAMAARAGNWVGVRIDQPSGVAPVRTPTPTMARVRDSSWPRGAAAVRWPGRSPAWMPATSIANTAVTAPDKNAAMATEMTAGDISLRRFRRLIGRYASRVSPFPGAGEIR